MVCKYLSSLSSVNAKFTLITLNKSLLYGAVPCNTQELECETINIFFISINNKHPLKGVIQDAENKIDVFQHIDLSCIPLDRQSCFSVDAKYMWSRIDVVSSSKRRHLSTWLIQTCNFTKEQPLHVVVQKYKIIVLWQWLVNASE